MISADFNYLFILRIDSGAAPKPAAPSSAPAASTPAPTPPPIAAQPDTSRPMTAVEQRGPRVYASPMAKRLAEAQALRLEGTYVILKCFEETLNFIFIWPNANHF